MLLQSSNNILVDFIGCTLIKDTTCQNTHDLIHSAIPIQSSILELVVHQVPPIADLPISIHHRSHEVTLLSSGVESRVRLEHPINLSLLSLSNVPHRFCVLKTLFIKRIGVPVVKHRTLGLTTRVRDHTSLPRLQTTIPKHHHPTTRQDTISTILSQLAFVHVALPSQLSLLFRSTGNLYIRARVVDFRGIALHHQSLVASKQSIFGLVFQSLMQTQHCLNTIAFSTPIHFVSQDFFSMSLVPIIGVLQRIERGQNINGVSCFTGSTFAQTTCISGAIEVGNVVSVHHHHYALNPAISHVISQVLSLTDKVMLVLRELTQFAFMVNDGVLQSYRIFQQFLNFADVVLVLAQQTLQVSSHKHVCNGRFLLSGQLFAGFFAKAIQHCFASFSDYKQTILFLLLSHTQQMLQPSLRTTNVVQQAHHQAVLLLQMLILHLLDACQNHTHLAFSRHSSRSTSQLHKAVFAVLNHV